MNTYKITLSIDDMYEVTQTWTGYDEQVAIAQCFLSNAQQGARNIKVLSIEAIPSKATDGEWDNHN